MVRSARWAASRARLDPAAVVLLDVALCAALQQAGGIGSRLARTSGIAGVVLAPLLGSGCSSGSYGGSSLRLRGCSLDDALARRAQQRQRHLLHRRKIKQGARCARKRHAM